MCIGAVIILDRDVKPKNEGKFQFYPYKITKYQIFTTWIQNNSGILMNKGTLFLHVYSEKREQANTPWNKWDKENLERTSRVSEISCSSLVKSMRRVEESSALADISLYWAAVSGKI